MKWRVRTNPAASFGSTELWLMSRSCQRATFSRAGHGGSCAARAASPLIRLAAMGLRLVCIAELLSGPGQSFPSTHSTSVRCRLADFQWRYAQGGANQSPGSWTVVGNADRGRQPGADGVGEPTKPLAGEGLPPQENGCWPSVPHRSADLAPPATPSHRLQPFPGCAGFSQPASHLKPKVIARHGWHGGATSNHHRVLVGPGQLHAEPTPKPSVIRRRA